MKIHPLARYRLENDLTQCQIEEMIGIKGVTQWESGKKRVSRNALKAMAKHLPKGKDLVSELMYHQRNILNNVTRDKGKTGNPLYEFRFKTRTSLDKAAAKTGLHLATLFAYEKGEVRPSLKTQFKVAQLLKVEVEEVTFAYIQWEKMKKKED